MIERRTNTARIAASTIVIIEESIFGARVEFTSIDGPTTRARQ
jgi:hypothetical protein